MNSWYEQWSGSVNRPIDLIVIHCSATRPDRPFSLLDLERAHRRRGFAGVGYHFYVRRNGRVHAARPLNLAGAHAKGYNARSIGICYEGGLDEEGRPTDTRTPAQCRALVGLVGTLLTRFPGCRVCGHRDLSPDLDGNGRVEPREWVKACPCFDARRLPAEVEAAQAHGHPPLILVEQGDAVVEPLNSQF